MRELTAIEIDAVSGAGWLKDGFASLGGHIGALIWSTSNDLVGQVEVPLLGSFTLNSIAPDLGSKVGSAVGVAIGFSVETALANVPVVGGLLNKLLGN